MKYKPVLFAWVVLLTFSAVPNVSAQWVQSIAYDEGYESFAATGTNLFVACGESGVFSSTDNGASWGFPGLNNKSVYTLAATGSNLFAGTDSGVYLSNDNGANWVKVNVGLPNSPPIVYSLFASGSKLFAGLAYGGIFRSTDSGKNWIAINTGLTDTNYFNDWTFLVSGANLFAGSADDGIFLSTNNGASWNPVNTGIPEDNRFYALTAIDTNVFAATDSGVYRSTNNGASWTQVDNGLTNTRVSALAVSGTNIFASNDSGVYLSSDNGSSWMAIDSGLTLKAYNSVNTLAVIGSDLFAGTNVGGIWSRPLSQMIALSAVSQTPSSQSEIQCYPNPFSQRTTINFYSEDEGYAEVTVVNLLGAQVARIFSGVLAFGEHTFTWDASEMAPGMYECVVRMNGNVSTVEITIDK
jgi:photosystem II stability/assembly factor-like uncharacterized protein